MSASRVGGSAIILNSMAGADTSKGKRSGGRRLKIAAVALWIVAIALVAVYFVERSQTDASAAGTTSSTVVAVSTTASRRTAHHDHHRPAHHRAADH